MVLTVLISQFTFAGGISGGGGNTVIEGSAGTRHTSDYLSSARVELLMYLKAMVSPNNYPDLFSENDGIHDKVKNYPLDIKETGSCYDLSGNESDASVYLIKNKICINAHRIGQKVTITNMRAQIIALLAHEYSHFMGYNEDQANQLQENLLIYTSYTGQSGGLFIGNTFVKNAESVINSLNKAQQAFEKNIPEKANFFISSTYKVDLDPYLKYFQALDRKEAVIVKNIDMRLKNILIYSCSRFELDPFEKSECKNKYSQIFNNASFVDAKDFKEKLKDWTTTVPTVKIYNLENNESFFKEEVVRISNDLKVMTDIIAKQLSMRDIVPN